MSDVNRFERLAIMAAREAWCWNLSCTTCGHMDFRFALKALALGLHPDDDDWPVHKRRGRSSRDFLAPPIPAGAWGVTEQARLQAAVVGCNLKNIAHVAPFPDWLGFVGLVLNYTMDAECEELRLTRDLGPQLLSMVEAGSAGELLLRERIGSGHPLLLHDLETIEHSIIGSAPQASAFRSRLSEPMRFNGVDWDDVPATPGAYVILDRDEVVYVGMAGKNSRGSLRDRLRSHSTGQIVNMFAQYLFLARVQFLHEPRIAHPREARAACHAYIQERCSFQFLEASDGYEARHQEDILKSELRPALNQ